MPRRAVVGWDASRLAMIVAVLETHAGLKLSQYDIYLTVAGGLRVGEPAADLAAAAALISSLSNIALGADSVFFGEIGLSGAIRPVSHGLARLKEAAKLGFRRATIPQGPAERDRAPKDIAAPKDLALRNCAHISDLVAEITVGRKARGREAPVDD
jgi:DNA repair protein RadA/Sms